MPDFGDGSSSEPKLGGQAVLEAVAGLRQKPKQDPATSNGIRNGKLKSVESLKDSHHMLARLFAIGLTNGEVAERAGYSISRVSILRNDPLFNELVQGYIAMVDDQFIESVDEYFRLAEAARIKSMRMINDKLDTEEDLSISELMKIHDSAADRTGYPKRTVATNINIDFAARLDQAISRSNKAKVINQPAALPSADAVDGEGVSGEAPSPPIRRLA